MQPATLDAALSVSPRRRDGRNFRKDRTRAEILQATRSMLATGDFRPTMAAVTKAAGYAIRTGFDIFGSSDALLVLALDDEATRRAILALILRDTLPPQTEADQDRLVRAVVFGRV